MPEIDRVAPTRRPNVAIAGTQRWRDLLFVHWTIDEAVLRAHVPASLELDTFEGRHYVGAVPFVMRAVRSRWMPRALGLNFLETNLRAYVVHAGRPGVYFFSLEAAHWFAVQVARAVWSLPYFHARMSIGRDGDCIRYTSERRDRPAASLSASYRIGETLGPSRPGTFEHFLLERYLLFSERRGELLIGQVHHSPYPVHRVESLAIEETLTAAAGLSRDAQPAIAHYSPGVDVEVFGPWPIDRAPL